MKRNFLLSLLFVLLLISCAPGTNLPGQVPTIVSDVLTQTAIPAAATPIPTAVTLPVEFVSKIAYQSPGVGIQFHYPSGWYLQDLPTNEPQAVVISSFDPVHPPHKLEWTDQTVFMQFSFIVLVTPPESFETWVENNKQAVMALGLSVVSDERFSIANQPAAHLNLVSGSGGILHHVLTELNGRYLRITVEGNYDIAKSVLNSIQPFLPESVKPADSESPASGICGEGKGDIVDIILGNDESGMPKAGRCLTISPNQRIKLINQSKGPFAIKFADYFIDLPVGGELLLARLVGEYLAMGVHFLSMGPELWVKAAVPGVTPVPTVHPPLGIYENQEVGYRLTLPGNMNVDESGLTAGTNKEVLFYPSNAEPFVAYLSISLDNRTLEQIKKLYAESVPDAVREDTVFSGQPALKYTYSYGRVEYYVPFENRLFLILSDKPQDGIVGQMLASIVFLPLTVSRYTNQQLSYSLVMPSNWIADENGMTATSREVRFYPPNAESFVSYLDIGLDPRSLDVLKAQDVPDAQKVEIFYAGQTGVQYIYSWGRSEMYLQYGNRVYYLISDRPADENVATMIGSFSFTP